jgi:hypothetical protein
MHQAMSIAAQWNFPREATNKIGMGHIYWSCC